MRLLLTWIIVKVSKTNNNVKSRVLILAALWSVYSSRDAENKTICKSVKICSELSDHSRAASITIVPRIIHDLRKKQHLPLKSNSAVWSDGSSATFRSQFVLNSWHILIHLWTLRGVIMKDTTLKDSWVAVKSLWPLKGWGKGPLCGFSKNVSSRDRVKACFFVTFDIIIGHIFPGKIWRCSPSVLTIFIDFSDCLKFPFYKEANEVSIYQMLSVFYFLPTLNRLFNNCVKLCW